MQLFIPSQQVSIAPVAVTWLEDGQNKLAIFLTEHMAFTWYSANSLWDQEGRVWSEMGSVIAPPADHRDPAAAPQES